MFEKYLITNHNYKPVRLSVDFMVQNQQCITTLHDVDQQYYANFSLPFCQGCAYSSNSLQTSSFAQRTKMY